MSTCIPADVSLEQLCYIPCNLCNIVLAVSVPCNNLLDMVTVRCGHCANLWSVNMAAAAFHSFSSSSSSSSQDLHHRHQGPNEVGEEYRIDMGGSSTARSCNKKMGGRQAAKYSNNERLIKRPSVKRQRVPSAYNQFIKEEIQRIKCNNPDVSHREAFSTAAKNWAHFPHIHFGLMMDTTKNQDKLSSSGI